MANTGLRSNHYNKALLVLLLYSILMLIQRGGAYEFTVGGSAGWTVPTDPTVNSYNQWAETRRFQIGDTLSFVYPADRDSVLRVNHEDYNNCNTAAPLDKFTDGHTVFRLNESGPYYFISGVEENCNRNEKFVVVVMADRSSNHSSNGDTALLPFNSIVTIGAAFVALGSSFILVV